MRTAPDDASLAAALRRCGHDQFRPGQVEAVTATLEGRDSLLVLPTGGGKSLTFQVTPVHFAS
jgi:superfamily II DNA helicase RecQ